MIVEERGGRGGGDCRGGVIVEERGGMIVEERGGVNTEKG